jgi:hypothetical protein
MRRYVSGANPVQDYVFVCLIFDDFGVYQYLAFSVPTRYGGGV